MERRSGDHLGEHLGHRPHIDLPAICVGPLALHQVGALEHAQVMGEQVGTDPKLRSQLPRGPVGDRQRVEEGQADRVGQGRVHGQSLLERPRR